VNLPVGGIVKAQIWDTAGQDRYQPITVAHCKRVVGALLVYDVTKQSTFQDCTKWMEDLRQNAEPGIVVMLVGNKVDLVEKDPSMRQVYYDAASEFARQHGLFFSEASAVTSHNVTHVFELLLQEIYYQNRKKSFSDPDPVQTFSQPVGIQIAAPNPMTNSWGTYFGGASNFLTSTCLCGKMLSSTEHEYAM